jgi:hypothetical protein
MLSILALWLGVAAAAAQSGVTFEVAAPTVVEAGELFRIEFVVNNASEGDIKFTPPTIEGFEVMAGPQAYYSSSYSNVNGEVTQSEITTYTYVLQGFTAGLHTISVAQATVAGRNFSTRPVTIEVVGAASGGGGASGASAGGGGGNAASSGGGQGASGQGGATGNNSGGGGAGGDAPEISDEDVFIRITANRSDVYKGEPVVVTLKFYRRRINAGLEDPKLPTFNGFWQQDITPAQSVMQRETYNNRVYDSWVLKEYLLYPQQSGTLTIEPFEATTNALFQVRSTSPGNFFDQIMGGGNVREVRKKIASQPLRIEVRDWPTTGRPESFDGAVGQFRFEATPPPSAMNANSSGSYTLRLSGTGNFPLVRAPKLELPQSFEQYNVTTSDNTQHTRNGTSGYREFSYPFIPRSDGLYTIPPFEFSYFDPQRKQYVTTSSREASIEVMADTTAVASTPGSMMSGISREDLRVFGQDIQFIKRGAAGLHPKGRVFMLSPLYITLAGLLVAMFVAGFLILPRSVRNMQSDRFVRGKRANKVALRRFRTAETSMKRDDRHGFYDEMLKALWGYISDKFDIPMADLTKERIREELFERNIPEAQSIEYVRIISECEEAQYSPVSSSRMGELYSEGVALVSELESAIKKS